MFTGVKAFDSRITAFPIEDAFLLRLSSFEDFQAGFCGHAPRQTARAIRWITQDLRRYIKLEILAFVPPAGGKLANATYFIRFT